MDDFEEEFSKLISDKILDEKAGWKLDPKESLTMLLEHVYEKALEPAHRILVQHEAFAGSDVFFEDEGIGDSVDDEMGYRAIATLRVVRNDIKLFEYFVTFVGSTETTEDRLWRNITINYPQTKVPLEEMSIDDIFPPEGQDYPPYHPPYHGKTTLDEDAIASLGEDMVFDIADMDEAARLVQEDLFEVMETLL